MYRWKLKNYALFKEKELSLFHMTFSCQEIENPCHKTHITLIIRKKQSTHSPDYYLPPPIKVIDCFFIFFDKILAVSK